MLKQHKLIATSVGKWTVVTYLKIKYTQENVAKFQRPNLVMFSQITAQTELTGRWLAELASLTICLLNVVATSAYTNEKFAPIKVDRYSLD